MHRLTVEMAALASVLVGGGRALGMAGLRLGFEAVLAKERKHSAQPVRRPHFLITADWQPMG